VEGLLILIGIWALDFIVKKVAENKKRQQELQQQQNRREEYRDDSTDFDDSEEPDYNEPEAKPSRSLQDLIRQFENAQREAEQGNIEPPVPPVSTRNLPSYNTRPATLHEIAEVVIDYESINLDFLVETFFIDYDQAKKRLAELQEYRIVGRDMGEGDCDVLVHDMDELENLFSRAQRQAQEQEEAERIRQENEAQLQAEREKMEAHRQELERQRKLNELENRAKSARESAAAFLGQDPAEAEGETRVNRRAPAVSTRNIADVRKGFIWAKVLDEPRFKRRWSAQYR
jgi:type II secretory pathway pseudopilin PulG